MERILLQLTLAVCRGRLVAAVTAVIHAITYEIGIDAKLRATTSKVPAAMLYKGINVCEIQKQLKIY
jgi:hypothetical protein